jgi:hypothetical protein
MASERVGDMTRGELEDFILQVVRAHEGQPYPYRLKSDRPVAEVLRSMRQNRIKRKPGQPSTLELLREDRDR